MSNGATGSESAWTGFRSLTGRTLQELSETKPTLVVFLRHAGCTFCREALADLAQRRSEIESRGSQIAIVYQESAEGMRPLLEKHGLSAIEQFSDPQRKLYEAFQLHLATLRQLFGLKTFWRGFKAAITSGHGFGGVTSNVYQMPGAFLLKDGKVIREFRHRSPSDRPDYTELACPI
jgi:hypothetical protein